MWMGMQRGIFCAISFWFSLMHTTTDLSDQECPAQKYYVQEYFLEPLLVFTIVEHTRTTNACTPICYCLHWTKAPAYLLVHHCNSMQCNDCMHSHHFHCNGRFCTAPRWSWIHSVQICALGNILCNENCREHRVQFYSAGNVKLHIFTPCIVL